MANARPEQHYFDEGGNRGCHDVRDADAHPDGHTLYDGLCPSTIALEETESKAKITGVSGAKPPGPAIEVRVDGLNQAKRTIRLQLHSNDRFELPESKVYNTGFYGYLEVGNIVQVQLVDIPAAIRPEIPAAPVDDGKLNCLPVQIKRAQIGTLGVYKTTDGQTDNNAFVQRSDVKPTGVCGRHIDASPGKVVAMWFDKHSYEVVRDHVEMPRGFDCMFLDDKTKLRFEDGPKIGILEPAQVLLSCPNSIGYECAKGSAPERSGKYEAEMKAKGIVLKSFSIPTNDNMQSLEARDGKWNGRDVFCQWTSSKHGVMFTTRYKIGPASADRASP